MAAGRPALVESVNRPVVGETHRARPALRGPELPAAGLGWSAYRVHRVEQWHVEKGRHPEMEGSPAPEVQTADPVRRVAAGPRAQMA
jgi:hypothetical protein